MARSVRELRRVPRTGRAEQAGRWGHRVGSGHQEQGTGGRSRGIIPSPRVPWPRLDPCAHPSLSPCAPETTTIPTFIFQKWKSRRREVRPLARATEAGEALLGRKRGLFPSCRSTGSGKGLPKEREGTPQVRQRATLPGWHHSPHSSPPQDSSPEVCGSRAPWTTFGGALKHAAEYVNGPLRSLR